jgi:hypothetical protein
MKLIFLILTIAMVLSACAGLPASGIVQPTSSQSLIVEPTKISSPQPMEQASTQTRAFTQPFTSTATIAPPSTPTFLPEFTETQTPTASLIISTTATPLAENAIIADHTVLGRFSAIPTSALSAAAAKKTLFMHQSTGNNIDYLGLQCLAGLQDDPSVFPTECSTYATNPYHPYDNRSWNWKFWDNPVSDAIAKTDQFVSVVNAQQSNYQVLGMKFCYVDGWNQDFDYYRQKMEGLEKAYPDKTFIWATSVIGAQSAYAADPASMQSCLNIQDFNQKLRAYARDNHKILYDLADIESHDPDGNLCQYNGCEVLCDVYYDGYGGGGGGHPDVDGSLRMAKGFWWLMARISGWDGN